MQKKRLNPIAVFVPYPEMAEEFERMRSEFSVGFDVYHHMCEEAVPVAKELAAQGCRIMIARSKTALMLKRALNIRGTYVIEIPVTDYDLLSMLTRALEYGRDIAFVGFRTIMNISKFINSIVPKDIRIKFYKVERVEDIPTICQQAVAEGFDIIAGTPRISTEAQRIGVIGIPLMTEKSALASVLRDAMKLYQILEQRKKSFSRQDAIYKTNTIVFDYNGTVLSDTTGIDKSAQLVISNSVQRVSSTRNFYGVITTPHEKLHYIINYIGNAAKNVFACCSLCRESVALPGGGNKQRQVTLDTFITRNEQVQHTLAYARGIAATDSTVIIYGSTGTGKSMLAAAIHAASPRCEQPFISINCASIPETLIESELFGYYGGAFTGANKRGKKGYFELAHGGTIFLDEVSELSLSAQSKILKFIEEQTFIPIGSEESVSVDVRVLCATNKSLEQLVQEQAFRSDLYYRLSVFELSMPALRDRREDILLLAEQYIAMYNDTYRHSFRLNKKTSLLLQEYDYPGNVRELRNIIERLVVTSKLNLPMDDVLTRFVSHSPVGSDTSKTSGLCDLRQVEQEHIRHVLAATRNNKTKAAAILGVSKSTLWRKCRELGIEVEA